MAFDSYFYIKNNKNYKPIMLLEYDKDKEYILYLLSKLAEIALPDKYIALTTENRDYDNSAWHEEYTKANGGGIYYGLQLLNSDNYAIVTWGPVFTKSMIDYITHHAVVDPKYDLYVEEYGVISSKYCKTNVDLINEIMLRGPHFIKHNDVMLADGISYQLMNYISKHFVYADGAGELDYDEFAAKPHELTDWEYISDIFEGNQKVNLHYSNEKYAGYINLAYDAAEVLVDSSNNYFTYDDDSISGNSGCNIEFSVYAENATADITLAFDKIRADFANFLRLNIKNCASGYKVELQNIPGTYNFDDKTPLSIYKGSNNVYFRAFDTNWLEIKNCSDEVFAYLTEKGWVDDDER